MKRWHLTAGLATTAIIAAALAPKLHALLAPLPPAPIEPVAISEIVPTEVIQPTREEAEPQGPLIVEAGLDRTAVLEGRTSERFLTIHVRAPDVPGQTQRSTANVAVVLDASGSMAAQGKIDYAKQAARAIVDELGPNDAFSLITFNDAARVVVPATQVDDPTRLKRQIDRVYEGGGTNLYDGMKRGDQQVQRVLDSGEVGRMIILSDGKANVGVTRGQTFEKLAAEAASHGVSVTAMGLGLDYNEDLLARIADLGGGTYDYIDNPDELSQVFAAELDRTTAVVARHTTLDITLPAGVEPVDVIGWDAQRTGDGWSLFMGDIPAGATRKIVARVKITSQTSTDAFEAAEVVARYTDLTGEVPAAGISSDTANAVITSDPNQVASSLDPRNAAAASRAWGNRYLELSTRAYEKGDQAAAVDYLREGSRVLREASATTGSEQLEADAKVLEKQQDVYRHSRPSAASGRRAIKMNKEFLRDAYR